MQTATKKQVIDAIGELGRRVTPADVATKTGLPVLVVQQELNSVASDTGGHLQVGNTGDIVYSFAPGFSNAYLAKGIQAAFETVFGKILAVGFYLLRISFGIMLILSLAIIVIILIAITVAMMMRGGNDDRDDGFDFGSWGSGGGFHFSFWDWMILRDLLWWNSSSRYYNTVSYDYDRPTVRKRGKSNFLLNCFSFLFGDGDPNEGLNEKRWQAIAQVIKQNKNVVTAEQLAPFTGADPKNEDGVLPVLVRFNGRPEVTEDGQIVYVFESLQHVAASQNVRPPTYLQEFPWKFSNTKDGELLPVYIVAGLNLVGAYAIYDFLAKGGLAMLLTESGVAYPPELMTMSYVLGVVLVVYGTAFVTVPAIRAMVNQIRNRGIDSRNVQRFQYAQVVQNPSKELSSKLNKARQYQLGEHRMAAKDMVFTTEKDARDQDDELSDKFKQMEKKPRQWRDPGVVIDASPGCDEEADEGRIINLKQKHTEEFDASP